MPTRAGDRDLDDAHRARREGQHERDVGERHRAQQRSQVEAVGHRDLADQAIGQAERDEPLRRREGRQAPGLVPPELVVRVQVPDLLVEPVDDRGVGRVLNSIRSASPVEAGSVGR